MQWAKPRRLGAPGTWTHEHISSHDLWVDGMKVGYVYHDDRPGYGYIPYTNPFMPNALRPRFPTQSTLEDAKALLVVYIVVNKLQGSHE